MPLSTRDSNSKCDRLFPSSQDMHSPSSQPQHSVNRISESPSWVFPVTDGEVLDCSQPIKGPGRRMKRFVPNSSPEVAPTQQDRLFICDPDSSPSVPRLEHEPSRKSQFGGDRRRDPDALLDLEAELSGPDIEDDIFREESDSDDREFLAPVPETQASPSYPQTQVYRQSLFTQPSVHAQLPAFRNKAFRPPSFVRPPRPQASSSPPRQEEGSDCYELDSFVVPDDEDIVDS